MNDPLQAFRMALPWPLIVGCAFFLAMRAVLYVARPQPERADALVCLVAGVAGLGLGWVIAGAWDGSDGYWVAYTVGLAGLAGVLLITVALSFQCMLRRGGANRGKR